MSSEETTPRRGFLGRLREGLSRSSARLTGSISAIFTQRRLDDETLEELEEALITADLGPATAARLCAGLAEDRYDKQVTDVEVREALAGQIAQILDPVAQPLTLKPGQTPTVILVVGVNGAGKTTTIGKLASQFRAEGKSVMIAAGDTFRAAAIDQLKVWGDRANAPVIAKAPGADSAGLAYEALEAARADNRDVLLIDTAGRLQNKANLMEELVKIRRVLGKLDPATPHVTLLVLDATTGQNAVNQVEVFQQMVSITGLVLTKLDGSSKGGVLVQIADRFKLPVHAIGVGEGIEDLRPFSARGFARSLMDLDD